MPDFSTPVLILGRNENSLSVTGHLWRLRITVKASGPMLTAGTAPAIPHHVTVK